MVRPVRWLLAFVVWSLTGCIWSQPTPVARVQHGPAFGSKPRIVVAMPVACLAEEDLCGIHHQQAIGEATRMALEFDGYSIVDSELVNAEMVRRRHTGREEQIVDGKLFGESSPAEQRQLLHDIGADGIVTTTVTISRYHDPNYSRTVAVEMAMLRLDGALVWWSQCRAESGNNASNDEAMDAATRCAIKSSTLW